MFNLWSKSQRRCQSITSLRKRDGVNTISFAYDALNRQIVKDSPPTGSSATDVYTDYDLAGRPIHAHFASRTGTGVDTVYDTAGRLTSETTFGRALAYQYDLAGNRTRVTWPDGFYAGYVYDAMNRMTAANENGAVSGAGLLAAIAYDDLGRRTTLGRGNGASTAYAYDTADRIVSLAHAFVGAPSNQTWTFGYNNASQRISRTSANALFDWTNHPPATVNKAYDGLNRDAAIAATTGGYDANGNLTFDGTRTFTYDVENRLLSGSAPTPITISYDPLGRLAQTTATSATTNFLYDGDKLTAEYDGSGNLLRRYVHGPGVDEPLVWYESSGTTDRRQLHQDPQGSIVAWSDGSGNTSAAQIQAYGPYGEPQAWSGSRFRYTGQIAILEAKLYYYKARVYDPATGRFLQTDPVGESDDLDLYIYARNDPTNRDDPKGLYTCGGGSCPKTIVRAVNDISTAAKHQTNGTAQAQLNELVTTAGANGANTHIDIDIGGKNPFGASGSADTDAKGNFKVPVSDSLVQAAGGHSSPLRAALSGVIAHEIRHGIDGRAAGGNPSSKEAEMQTERNASRDEINVNQGLERAGIASSNQSNIPGPSASPSEVSAAIESNAAASTAIWCASGGPC